MASKRRRHDPDWEPPIPGRRRVLTTWDDYMALAKRVLDRFDGKFDLRYFDYHHPTRLQKCEMRFRKPYPVRVAYTDWGEPSNPIVVCVGGVANSAMRFNYLAADLESDFRVICMDWVGRGRSGWMADQRDYSLATYAEQIRQLIDHVASGPVIVLGSSLGGSAAIEFAARNPSMVTKLILNDIGPYIPKKRRARRSQTLARHYVVQWRDWTKVRCPVLVIHGMLSDALLPATLLRMQRKKNVSVMHVPDTGHTPVLSDRNQNYFIRQWLTGKLSASEWSVLHAKLRDDPAPEAAKPTAARAVATA